MSAWFGARACNSAYQSAWNLPEATRALIPENADNARVMLIDSETTL
ncbi:hypothetical protein PSAC2689_60298 [Paraburkholderia sacchari]